MAKKKSAPARKAKLNIGITIGMNKADESLWINGIKQNAIYLAEALKHCPGVGSVCLVNTIGTLVTDDLQWDQARWPVQSFEQSKDTLHILIELGGQISADQTAYLKERKCRLVSYCCSVEYVFAMQSVMFGRPLWGYDLFINQRYDDIWMVPQVAANSQAYFEVLRRHDARIVPFVWDPTVITKRTAKMNDHGCYVPHDGPKRLTVMEPNHDIVKFCLYPSLIAELAYRAVPHRIDKLQVTNAERLAKDSREFIALMNQLDIVRQHKAIFLGCYETPYFLKMMSDIVISHQSDNPLNYFYFDVCWQGFPLVHNASLCSDLGYFYEENNIRQGAEILQHVLQEHDHDWEGYQQRQRAGLKRFIAGHPDITGTYQALLDDLMTREPI